MLQNLLYAQIIVEFRDRSNVERIMDERHRRADQIERREALGRFVGKDAVLTSSIAETPRSAETKELPGQLKMFSDLAAKVPILQEAIQGLVVAQRKVYFEAQVAT